MSLDQRHTDGSSLVSAQPYSPHSPASPSMCESTDLNNASSVRKRTRASPAQLAVLEAMFTTNASPNNKQRKQLSLQLDMSERSIQIWFQNRRAKVKHMQKKAQIQIQQHQHQFQRQPLQQQIPLHHQYQHQYHLQHQPSPPLTQTSLPQSYSHPSSQNTASSFGSMDSVNMTQTNVPVSMHTPWSSQYILPPRYWAESPPPKPAYLDLPAHVAAAASPDIPVHHPSPILPPSPESVSLSLPLTVDPAQLTMPTTAAHMNRDVIQLGASSLTIGGWLRLKTPEVDLTCEYNPSERVFAWYVTDRLYRFKMEIPMDHVQAVQCVDGVAFAEILLHLAQPPLFYRCHHGAEWTPCPDFTQNGQASQCLRHILRGPASVLKRDLGALQRFPEKVWQHIEHRSFTTSMPTPTTPAFSSAVSSSFLTATNPVTNVNLSSAATTGAFVPTTPITISAPLYSTTAASSACPSPSTYTDFISASSLSSYSTLFPSSPTSVSLALDMSDDFSSSSFPSHSELDACFWPNASVDPLSALTIVD